MRGFERYRVDEVALDGTGTLVLVAPETSKRTFRCPGYHWSLLASKYVPSSAGNTSYDRRMDLSERARQGCGGDLQAWVAASGRGGCPAVQGRSLPCSFHMAGSRRKVRDEGQRAGSRHPRSHLLDKLKP